MTLTYDMASGRINNEKGKPVAFLAARNQTIDDPFGQKLGNLLAAAPDLYAAAKHLSEVSDAIWIKRVSDGEMKLLSDAWDVMEAALAKADGKPLASAREG